MVRIEHADQAPHDRHEDASVVDLRCHRIGGEPGAVPGGDERILVDVAGRAASGSPEFVQRVARSLPEVRRLDEVGEDVVAVVAQERIAVHGERVDGADDHDVEGHELHHARLGIPPDDRGQRCDHELDEHAGGGDEDPLPFARRIARRR